MVLEQKGYVRLEGKSVLFAFRPGEIQRLLDYGTSLHAAIRVAIAQGALIEHHVKHNLIVNNGLGLMGDLIIAAFGNGLTYHAIGTGVTAPAVTDTQLGTEVFRNAFATRIRSANVATLDAFYPLAQSNYNIKEEGVFGGTASGTANSGTLFSHYAQAYNNTVAQADLTFEYRLTLTGA